MYAEHPALSDANIVIYGIILVKILIIFIFERLFGFYFLFLRLKHFT